MHKLTLLLLFCFFETACTLVSAVASGPEYGARYIAQIFGSTNQVDPVAVQDDLLRFADDFISTESIAISELVAAGAKMDRYKEVKLKMQYASDMLTLATGSNPIGDLINVVVYITSLKESLEQHWLAINTTVPGQPVLSAIRSSEKDIWTIAGRWLSPEQLSQLRESIKVRAQVPSKEDQHNGIFASISLVNDILVNTTYGANHDNSLFSLLDLDPLAGLDPAARELTQTRLFGERTLFVGKHMPQLVEWQAELLSLRTLKNPTITALVDNAGNLTKTAGQMGETLERFPQIFTSERKAIIEELKREAPELKSLSSEMTRTFEEGQRMASAVSEVLSGIAALRSQSDSANAGDDSMSGKDYVEFISHLEGSLGQVNALLKDSGETNNVSKLIQLAQALRNHTVLVSDEIIDHAFKKLMILVTYSFILAAGLLYLWAKIRAQTPVNPK